ncbi:MAG: N-acetyltransferase [Actinobacteria bacterium]|nr:MAG: N-acetyltransferase [Actinomycetota bacterium]
MSRVDQFGLPVGEPVADWAPRPLPPRAALPGRYCTVEPLHRDHGPSLFAAYSEDAGAMWTYMGYGPFPEDGAFQAWLDEQASSEDPRFHAITVGGEALGLAAYLRVQPEVGVIEIGHISLAPRLRRTTAATEGIALLMRRAFDELGYRRLEWKADALNAASAAAAVRLGFTYEGTFRKATIYKGRNRDTAWYAIVDDDWPLIRSGLDSWLDPANFDEQGRQIRPLAAAGGAPL